LIAATGYNNYEAMKARYRYFSDQKKFLTQMPVGRGDDIWNNEIGDYVMDKKNMEFLNVSSPLRQICKYNENMTKFVRSLGLARKVADLEHAWEIALDRGYKMISKGLSVLEWECVTADIDVPLSYDDRIRLYDAFPLKPNYSNYNSRNGHFTFYWLLDKPMHGKQAPKLYMDTRAALAASISHIAKADISNSHNCRNPLTDNQFYISDKYNDSRMTNENMLALSYNTCYRIVGSPQKAATEQKGEVLKIGQIVHEKATPELRVMLETIFEGCRNNTIFRTTMKSTLSTSYEEVLHLATKANEFCSPPLPPKEIQGIAKSVTRYNTIGQNRIFHSKGTQTVISQRHNSKQQFFMFERIAKFIWETQGKSIGEEAEWFKAMNIKNANIRSKYRKYKSEYSMHPYISSHIDILAGLIEGKEFSNTCYRTVGLQEEVA